MFLMCAAAYLVGKHAFAIGRVRWAIKRARAA